MSLLTHLLSADVRRLRLTMALWVTALVVESVVTQMVSFLPMRSERWMTLMLTEQILSLATTLLSWALVPLVIQLHPAVGTQAFWMTRPIPPPTLVTAKVLSIAVLFVGVPLAIEQAVMAMNDVPLPDMGRVALQTVVYRGLFMAALGVAAALTPNLARFALLCGAALFAFALLPLALMTITAGEERPQLSVAITAASGSDLPVPRQDQTSQLVGIVLLLVTSLATIAVQYARRRVRISIAVAAAGIGVALLISGTWQWRLISAPVLPPAWASASDALRVAADVAAASFNPPGDMHGLQPRWVVRVPLTMTAAPRGSIGAVRVSAATVNIGGTVLSTTLESAASTPVPDPAGQQPRVVAFQEVLQVGRVVEWEMLNPRREHSGLVVYLPPDLVGAANVRTAAMTAQLVVDVAELDVAAVMPLARGHFQDGAYSVSVQEVRETPMGVVVYGRVASLATVFDRRVRPMYSYFLRNRQRSEAIRGSLSGWGGHVGFAAGVSFGVGGGATDGGFAASSLSIAFNARDPATPEAQPLIDRDWVRDAELVIVRVTHAGAVNRTLAVSNLPLGNS